MNELVKFTPVEYDAEDSVRVFIATHPLRNQSFKTYVPSGLTVREIVDIAIRQSDSPYPIEQFEVWTEEYIPYTWWDRVRLKSGTTIVMRPRLEDPISLLLGTLGTTLAGAFGGGIIGGLISNLIIAGIGIGLKFLMNMLFAPKQKNDAQIEPKVGYSLTGSRNTLNQWGEIPSILGVMRVAPYLGAQPITENVGAEQYIRMLFVVGYGPLAISQLQIGETPIANFDGVTYEIKQGFNGDPETRIYARNQTQEDFAIDLKHADGFHVRVTATDVTEIQLDFLWQNGLIWIDGDGNRNIWTTPIVWSYQPVTGGAWIDKQIIVKNHTQDTIRRTERVTVTAGQYNVRVRKDAAEVTLDKGYIAEDVSWTALRGIRLGEPISFTKPICVIAIRMQASAQLNGVIDTLNCVATSLVNSYNGAAWVANTASAQPSDLFRHVLQGPANARPEIDARVDLPSLQAWRLYNIQQGFTYNNIIARATSVLEMLYAIAAAGRATPVQKDGKWGVVWDEQSLPIAQMFTPRNSWNFEFQHSFDIIPHALRVRFIDANKKWVDNEVVVYNDGYNANNSTIYESQEFEGVTNHDANWKHGRFFIAQKVGRPATYTLMCGREGAFLTRADRIRVAHDAILVGLSWGRVKSVAGQVVTFDETLTLTSANPLYAFIFRLSTNVYITRTVTGVNGTFNSITLNGVSTMPVAGDLYSFGISGIETGIYRVLGIEPVQEMNYRITMVDDAPEISLADTGTIPPFDGDISQPLDPFEQPPSKLVLIGGAYAEGAAFYEFITASWSLTRIGHTHRIDTQIKNEDDDIWVASGSVLAEVQTLTIRKLDSGLYTVRIRAVFQDGTFSRWVQSAVFKANALTTSPPQVTNFRISSIGSLSTLTWDKILNNSGLRYDVRFSTLLTGATWNTASPLLSNIDATSAQVQTMIGTYLIKAKLINGLSSTNATVITSSILSLDGLNFIATLTENPAFTGTKVGTEVVASELRLQERNVMSSWDFLSNVISLYEGLGVVSGTGFVSSGTYYFINTLDLGVVLTSRLTWNIVAYGFSYDDTMSHWLKLSDVLAMSNIEPSDWGVELQFRVTQVDPALAIWSGWQTFYVGDVTGRAFEFRLLLTGKAILDSSGDIYAKVTPSVQTCSIQIDMPDRLERGNDIACPIGGMDIIFPNGAFRVVPAVAVTGQNMATTDYFTITAKAANKFHIQFFNGSNVAIAGRTFDWIAKGYGRVQ